MKKLFKSLLALLCAVVFVLPVLAGCGENSGGSQGNETPGGNQQGGETSGGNQQGGNQETVDYVSELHLDLSSNSKKQEVKVRLYIDGDTTHFDPVKTSKFTTYNASDFAKTDGYIKARYLAVNTPESTGHIEKWGKKASDFTYEHLRDAEAIIVESDDEKWNIDSTGERYTLWIWYVPDGKEVTVDNFRNLNVEILQNGLATASNTANNRYGDIAMAALNQAKAQRLYVFAPASKKDPNFFEGGAIEMDIKYLRANLEEYIDKAVRVEGLITARFSESVYLEYLDKETGNTYGFPVYYGFQSGEILRVLTPGNYVSVRGSVNFFDPEKNGKGTYQISGVKADPYYPNDEGNSRVIDLPEGVSKTPAYKTTTIDRLLSTNKVNVTFSTTDEDGEDITKSVEMVYAEAYLSTTVCLENLTVVDGYVTKSGDSKDTITLYCTDANGKKISIRMAEPFYDPDDPERLLGKEDFLDKTVNIKGLIEAYYADKVSWDTYPYQIKVPALDCIEVLD